MGMGFLGHGAEGNSLNSYFSRMGMGFLGHGAEGNSLKAILAVWVWAFWATVLREITITIRLK